MLKELNQHIDLPSRLSLHTNKGKQFFLPGQIVRLEAKSNYTKIYFINHFSLTTPKVLKKFEPLLMPWGFLRTHRSHLVNKKYILQVCNGTVIMNDLSTAEISKRRKAAVIKDLQIFRGSA